MVAFYSTTLSGNNSIGTLTKNKNNYKPSNDSNVYFQECSFMKDHSLACPIIASLNYFITLYCSLIKAGAKVHSHLLATYYPFPAGAVPFHL